MVSLFYPTRDKGMQRSTRETDTQARVNCGHTAPEPMPSLAAPLWNLGHILQKDSNILNIFSGRKALSLPKPQVI